MPGPLLHLGATVLCAHGGQAQPTVPNPRVTVSGQPVVTLGPPYVVAGCPFAVAPPGPCLTGMFVTAATRVLVGLQPVLLLSSQGVCAPTGVPLVPTVAQPRVVAT